MIRDPFEPMRETILLPDGRKLYRYTFPGAEDDNDAQVSSQGDKDVTARVEEVE